MSTSFLSLILIYLFAALIFVPLFKKLGLGNVLGYLAAGMILGPWGFKVAKDPEAVLHFAEIGVVILLFLIGLELQPRRLWSMRRAIFGLGGIQVVFTALILALCLYPFTQGFSTAFLVGLFFALSSTAFAIQLLAEKNQLTTTHGRSAFSILLFQDIAAIPLLAIVPLLAQEQIRIEQQQVLTLLKIVVFLASFLTLGRYAIRYLFRYVANTRSNELFTATSLFLILGVSYIMLGFGLSMALGSFLAGVLLSDSEYRHQLEAAMDPFKGLLLGLFFMGIGMTLDVSLLKDKLDFILIGVTILFIIKTAVVYAIGRAQKMNHMSSLQMGLVLSQGGEFAFVLFGLAVQVQLLTQTDASMYIIIVTLSMVLSALAFAINEKLTPLIYCKTKADFDEIKNEKPEVIIAGFGRVGQIPGRILRALGSEFTALELDAEQATVVRKFGHKIYYGDAGRLDLLQAAGAADAKYFVLAIDDVDASVNCAALVREHFPHLRIFARARNREHVFRLMDLGVKDIWRETLSSSIELTSELLHAMGIEKGKVDSMLKKFRDNDEEILLDQHKVYTNEKEMMTISTRSSQQLSDLLKNDEI
jgi:glutathione-regulated potassium-efflux system ancillary protein KefC